MTHETDLYEVTAKYLALKHPQVIFHYDLAGVNNPSKRTRSLYGRLNRRAWPDLFIAQPMPVMFDGERVQAHGLFIEQKREGTRLRKRDGSWASDHIAEQAAVLEALREQGYAAGFCVGYDETVEAIGQYLGSRQVTGL